MARANELELFLQKCIELFWNREVLSHAEASELDPAMPALTITWSVAHLINPLEAPALVPLLEGFMQVEEDMTYPEEHVAMDGESLLRFLLQTYLEERMLAVSDIERENTRRYQAWAVPE